MLGQMEHKNPGGGSARITLKVKNQNEQEVHFRIRRDTKLKKLMDAYCAREGVDSLVFMLDDLQLKGDQTPEELQMEDGYLIDVFGHQIGGSQLIKAWIQMEVGNK